MVALGVTLFSIGDSDTRSGQVVVIKTLKGETLVHELKEAADLEIEGLAGKTRVRVGPEGVAFLDSPCPHKLCIRKGSIKRTGEWVLCLPNGVMAEIVGEADYDGITP
jgi:hypothetical protein